MLIGHELYIFQQLKHFCVLFFPEEGHNGDPVLQVEGKRVHVVVNYQDLLEVDTLEDP